MANPASDRDRGLLLRKVADATIGCTRRVVADLRENDGRNPVGIFQETEMIVGSGRFAIEVCVIDLDKYPAGFATVDRYSARSPK